MSSKKDAPARKTPKKIASKDDIRIPAEEYNEMIAGLQLYAIYMQNHSAELKDRAPLFEEGLRIKIGDSISYELNDDKLLEYSVRYDLTAKAAKRNKIALKISGTFHLMYEGEVSLTDEFADLYAKMSLPVNVWPFFREFVHSVTARMEIPPLTLPLLRRP